MIVTINELQTYFKEKLNPEKVKEELTLKGLEVVEMKKFSPLKSGLKIGEVIKKENHPNADRLFLTTVKYFENDNSTEVKKEKLAQIVCGAQNFKVNAKVVVATPGTVLENGIKIKKSKIRGLRSEGMICSKAELGLEEKSEGIWVLPESTGLDDQLKDLLGPEDYIFDIDLTSNRSDCQNVYGLARELSSILNYKFISFNDREINPKLNFPINNTLDYRPQVVVKNSAKCPLYLAALIKGVIVKESPDWLKEKLRQHGFRSINNVVDITNLMLIEYGQPMHAFDEAKVKEKIIVREAVLGEKFCSLENKTYQLNLDDLVITDKEKIIGIAGVIGGINSEVENKTKNIILEAAYFNPETVRKTSNTYKIASDASFIFSKEVDHTFTFPLIKKAVSYIQKLAGGKVGPITEINHLPKSEKIISFNSKEIKKTLGLSLTENEIKKYFSRLFFETEKKNDYEYKIKIPNFRKDINHSWDLIEEIARLYGYNNFPSTLPAITNNQYNIFFSRKNEVIYLLKGMGYHEIITYPFIEKSFVNQFDKDGNRSIEPENPLLKNISTLRKDLLFGMLKTININQEKKQVNFNKAFEIGRVFSEDKGNYLEEEMIALAGWGTKEIASWHKNTKFDFYDLKGDLEEIVKQLHLPNFSLREKKSNLFSENLCAEILMEENKSPSKPKLILGYLGMVKKEILEYFNLKNKAVYFLTLSLSQINSLKLVRIKYKDGVKFPSISRDINLILAEEKVIGNLIKDINLSSKLLKKVDLINTYSGKEIGKGRRSVVIRLEFSSFTKTLVKEEADREVENIIKKIRKKYQFELR